MEVPLPRAASSRLMSFFTFHISIYARSLLVIWTAIATSGSPRRRGRVRKRRPATSRLTFFSASEACASLILAGKGERLRGGDGLVFGKDACEIGRQANRKKLCGVFRGCSSFKYRVGREVPVCGGGSGCAAGANKVSSGYGLVSHGTVIFVTQGGHLTRSIRRNRTPFYHALRKVDFIL